MLVPPAGAGGWPTEEETRHATSEGRAIELRSAVLALIAAVTAVVIAAAAAAETRPTANEPIVIGIATAQTGFIAAFDKPAVSGAMIAVDDINKAGGVLGRSSRSSPPTPSPTSTSARRRASR